MLRLKTRSQFQAVLAGSTVARTTHFALHCVALDAQDSNQAGASPAQAPRAPLFVIKANWLGALVPKRWAKRAVTRNAIKRQIYNVGDDYDGALPVAAHVVRLRMDFCGAGFVSASSEALKSAVRRELEQLFDKAAAGLVPCQARATAA